MMVFEIAVTTFVVHGLFAMKLRYYQLHLQERGRLPLWELVCSVLYDTFHFWFLSINSFAYTFINRTGVFRVCLLTRIVHVKWNFRQGLNLLFCNECFSKFGSGLLSDNWLCTHSHLYKHTIGFGGQEVGTNSILHPPTWFWLLSVLTFNRAPQVKASKWIPNYISLPQN